MKAHSRWPTLLVAWLLLIPGTSQLVAQSAAENQAKPTESTEADKPDPLEAEIVEITKAYEQAYNEKDVDKILTFWTEKGVYLLNSNGVEFAGKDKIRAELKSIFEGDDKRQVQISIRSLEKISPSVVLQRGTATITTGEEETIISNFRTVLLKQGDKWLIDRVSEDDSPVEPTSNYEYLQPLEWIIGSWTDQFGDSTVNIECSWAANRNFISRAFTVFEGEVSKGSGLEIIGWDSKQQKIRSWLFDSNGGIIESSWKQKGDRWIVSSVATMAGGGSGSYTSVYRPMEDGKFGWQKINQQVDGELLPNLDEVIISRKQD